MKLPTVSAIAFLLIGFTAMAQQDSSGNSSMGMKNGNNGKIGRMPVSMSNTINAIKRSENMMRLGISSDALR